MQIFAAFTNENILVFTAVMHLLMIKNVAAFIVPPMKNSNFHCFEFRKIHFYFMVILRTSAVKLHAGNSKQ